MACGSPPPPLAPPPPPPLKLEFEFVDCLYTLAPAENPTCVLDEGKPDLRLWAHSSDGTPIVIAAGGQRWLSGNAEAVQGGFLFRLEGLNADEVVVQAGSGETRIQLTLPLEKAERPPYLKESRERLEVRFESGVPTENLGYLLRVLASKERQARNYEVATQHLDAAARAFKTAGQLTRQITALTAEHHILLDDLEELEKAGEILSILPRPPAGEGLSSFDISFSRGAWANRNGRFRAALRELEEASRQAERLDLARRRYYAELERVHLLSRLGRYTDARQLIEWLETEANKVSNDPQKLVEIFTNIGWSQLLMLEAGRVSNPVPALTRALAAAEVWGDRETIRNAELNLALANLYAGHLEQSKEHLARVKELEGEPPWWIRVWLLDIEARLALAEGRPRVALKFYQQLAKGSETIFHVDAEWRAAIGRAQALEALERWEEALAAYAEAETKVWKASLAVPLGEGRRSSTSFYQRGTSHLLELLIQLERWEEALELARRSRSRHFRGLVIDTHLAELDGRGRSRWDALIARCHTLRADIHAIIREVDTVAADQARNLRAKKARLESELETTFDKALLLLDAGKLAAAEDLSPPRAGELLLTYHPFEKGWIGFAKIAEKIDIKFISALNLDLPEIPSEVLSEKFLEPFAEAIRSARKIRILPYGELWGVHFQALPFDDGILLKQAPVTYGLDLPPRDLPPPDPTRSGDALLVADPTRSLTFAASEVAQVKQQLEAAKPSWRVRLLPPAEATVAAVREELAAGPALFHFSGHGNLIGRAGQSGLVLAETFEDKELLTIPDLLTLERAPATVVLSGCETVRPAALEVPASLGVGHAFLLAGSLYVVGALEKVDDRQAVELFRLFYDHWQGPGSEAEALRQAQLKLYDGTASSWMSFRVLER